MIARHWRKVLVFGGIGGFTLCVGQVLLLFLVEVGAWNEVAANAVQLVLTLCLNFVLNRVFTWRARRGGFAAFARFAASRFATMALSFALFTMMVVWLDWHYLVANAFGVGVATGLNYLIGEMWVFQRRVEG